MSTLWVGMRVLKRIMNQWKMMHMLYSIFRFAKMTTYDTSIGRFAVYREFVNIENSPHDCAQDRQEDPQDGAQDRQEELQGDHFWPRWCPRSPRGAPRGSFWGQDDAQDRPEERQGDDFMVKMVPKVAKRSPKGDILGPRWCSRSSAKFFKAKVTKSVRVLLKWPKVGDS